MVWSELGAAMPGSGGSYRYLREGFGRERWGRLVAFLFIWQFILSGPLEIASGYIGFSQYLQYVWPDLTAGHRIMVAMAVGVLNIALLYRQIESIGTLTVSLWIGTLLTTFAVIATGLFNFNAAVAFDLPPNAFAFSTGFLLGLGAASRVGIYDYLGYYNICYIGDEVKNPGKVIPQSILISVMAVAAIYIGINLSIIGVVPWREFVPAADHPQSNFIVSIFMERIYGAQVATLFTALVLWTAFGSVFALLLGYSRIPYAAALDGTFFKVFAKVPPDQEVPARLAAADRHHRDRLQRAVARHGDRRADHDAHPDPVHRPDRRADAAAQERAEHAAAVPRVAVSDSERDRAVRMDLPVRHFRSDRHRVRSGHAAARRRHLLHLELAHAALAIRGSGRGASIGVVRVRVVCLVRVVPIPVALEA